MKLMPKYALFCFFALTLSGCNTFRSNQVSLTYLTQPQGAMLYEGNVAWGVAPQRRIYTGDLKVGQITTREVTAVWISGAKATTFINLPMGQGDRQTVISRPMDAPGLDKDLAYAAQLQQQVTTAVAADAQRRAANAAAIRAAGMRQPPLSPALPQACIYNQYGIKELCFTSLQQCIAHLNFSGQHGECH